MRYRFDRSQCGVEKPEKDALCHAFHIQHVLEDMYPMSNL